MIALNLETKRLALRPMEEGDHADLWKVFGDAETMVFYPEPYTTEMVDDLIERNRKRYEEGRFGLFAMIEKDSGELIGDCGITIQDIQGKPEHEIGYHIRKDRWGRGYAPEAGELIKAYGFEELGLPRLCSYMASNHYQSRRVAEKIGMRWETEYRNPRNRNLLTTVYALMAEEHE